MNANLRKLLQNLLALIVLPALGWYLTQDGTVHVVDTEHAYRKGRAVAWLFKEFGVTGVWGFLGIAWIVCLFLAIRSYQAWQKDK
ncbi:MULTISPECIES: hypothetical protein [Neisseria]|jgi:putative ABC transporter, ATPase subunit|uniref:hypothetical protein n=1 Tax=Neisseria TaxID=482 RepID=UPI0008A1798F|nr:MULTISPECIES: hypothetical protein [Neisseria]MBF1284690.1 hypothetical protein [Neisseria sp.]OFN83965.1 hypothetical protein HMPREF2572_00410 [Neisseria sp. HMSC064E01]